MVVIMKKLTKTLFLAVCTLSFISCASKSSDSYDYSYDDSYDYTLDESDIIIAEDKAESNENFLADIDPVELEPLYFLRKSRKTMKPLEVRKVALVPRTNAVEFHFRESANDIAIILRKAERDKILEGCQNFLDQYESKTLEHFKVNSKTAYFKSKCSLWYGLMSPNVGCEANEYFVSHEFIDKRPYLLIRFLPTRTTSDNGKNFTPKISLYMSPSQVRDFIEQMDQTHLEMTIQENKKKAYTY